MIKNIMLTALVIVTMTGATFAQESLTLSDAIQKGLDQNYDIRIEAKTVEINQNNNAWGQAGRYPGVTLEVGGNGALSDNVKTASPFQAQGITQSVGVSPALNVNWTLFNGFKVNMTKRRFEQLMAESQGNASVVIANTLQAIVLGYFNVVTHNQRLSELEKQLELSRDKFDYIKVKSALGSAVAQERLVEEGNYLTDSLNYIAQQQVLRDAKRALNLLMAESDLDKDYDFPATLEFENPAYNYDQLKEKMLAANVDLKKQFITQTVLATNTEIARADRYPSLMLNGRGGLNSSYVNLSKAQFFQGGEFVPGPEDWINQVSNQYSLGLSLSFTLFNGGRINRAIQNALIQEDIGNLRLDKMRLSMDRDLRRTLDLYNTRKQIYDINERREEVARINLELSRDKFRSGSINSFDYRVVQNNYLGAATLKLQALYSLIESHVALMRLTGGLVETYND
ncbi:MAG: TolC family protein [Cyclobacteriaceae bacterium]